MPELHAKDIQEETFDDLIRRYNNGYFLMYNAQQTEGIPVQIFGIDGREGNPTVLYRQLNGVENKVHLKEIKLVEVYPDKGLYNFDRAKEGLPVKKWWPVIMYYRKPRRQWAHGIRRETSVFNVAFGHMLDDAAGTMNTSIIEDNGFQDILVDTLFHPRYPDSYEKALKSIESNPIVALSKDFGLMHSPKEEKTILLIRHLRVVGKADERRITLHEPLFGQEVLDLIKRNKFQVNVEMS